MTATKGGTMTRDEALAEARRRIEAHSPGWVCDWGEDPQPLAYEVVGVCSVGWWVHCCEYCDGDDMIMGWGNTYEAAFADADRRGGEGER